MLAIPERGPGVRNWGFLPIVIWLSHFGSKSTKPSHASEDCRAGQCLHSNLVRAAESDHPEMPLPDSWFLETACCNKCLEVMCFTAINSKCDYFTPFISKLEEEKFLASSNLHFCAKRLTTFSRYIVFMKVSVTAKSFTQENNYTSCESHFSILHRSLNLPASFIIK